MKTILFGMRMSTLGNNKQMTDYVFKDTALVDFDRKELDIAENEMP